MKLKVLGSNSLGNGYILECKDEAIIIETGMKLPVVKKAINYKVSKLVGCLVSHEHNDHSKYYADYLELGIPVLSHKSVPESKGFTVLPPFAKVVEPEKGYKLGNFRIIPFPVQHDVPAYGYFIDHPESGRIVFLTDTYYCEYFFDFVNHWMIEANYADSILDEKIASGQTPASMRPRLLKSHMELETTKQYLVENDLSNTDNIILIHLSDGNSDEKRFVSEVRESTGKQVYAAAPGLTIELNKSPY